VQPEGAPDDVHVNLLGWVSMFIYGVAYHALPRFTGQPLHSPRLVDLHVVLANVGLVGLAVAFAAQGAGPFVAFFGVVEAVSGLLFVYNVGRTLLAARRTLDPLPLLRGAGVPSPTVSS
jgi:hypothetical protein